MSNVSFSGINAIIPARNAASITASDSTNFTYGITKGIYVGTGGDIAVVMAGDGDSSSVTIFSNVPSGSILPVQAKRVNSTSTTASDLVGLY